jgi:hypothetical protein
MPFQPTSTPPAITCPLASTGFKPKPNPTGGRRRVSGCLEGKGYPLHQQAGWAAGKMSFAIRPLAQRQRARVWASAALRLSGCCLETTRHFFEGYPPQQDIADLHQQQVHLNRPRRLCWKEKPALTPTAPTATSSCSCCCCCCCCCCCYCCFCCCCCCCCYCCCCCWSFSRETVDGKEFWHRD